MAFSAPGATQSGMWTYWEYTIDNRRLHAQQRFFAKENNCFQDGTAFELELGG